MQINVFGHMMCLDIGLFSQSIFIRLIISSVISHSSSSSASGPQSIWPSQWRSAWMHEQLFVQKNSVGLHFISHSCATAVPEFWWWFSSKPSSSTKISSLGEKTLSRINPMPPGYCSSRFIPICVRNGSWIDGACIGIWSFVPNRIFG